MAEEKLSVSIQHYLERILDERDLRYQQRFEEQEKASIKASAALKEYKVASNEWRETINDLRSSLLPRLEYDVKHESLQREIAELQKFRSEIAGRYVAKSEDRGQSNWAVGVWIAIGLGLLNLIIEFMKH